MIKAIPTPFPRTKNLSSPPLDPLMSYSSYLQVASAEGSKSDAPHDYLPTAPSVPLITTSKRSETEWPVTSDSSLKVVPDQQGKRLLAVTGLLFTLIAGIGFATTGIVIYFISARADEQAASAAEDSMADLATVLLSDWVSSFGVDPKRERTIFVSMSETANIALGLVFSILVTVCTEATGYVHVTTLKWGLAEEGRLSFNANLRLFTASRGAFSVNGPVVNALYGVSIVFAYAASSSFFLRLGLGSVSMISFIPPIVLGIALILQAVLGLAAFYRTPVVTWSSDPLDITSALVLNGRIQRRQKRCMRSIWTKDDSSDDPIRPSPLQPSPWASHENVARVVYLVWGVAAVWIVIGGGLALVPLEIQEGTWIPWRGGAPPGPLLYQSLLVGALQSVVTIGVHCCELVTTLSRDEVVWRKASGTKGARPAGNPLKGLLGSWQSLALLAAKPLIHWIFGLAVSLHAGNGFSIAPQYMIGLGGGMIVVATFITFIATRRPSGPQPAAYGHIQTLADLVDEWSTTMYWGHKGNRDDGPWPVCHAGTTDEGVLPPIKMGEVYA